MVWELLFGATYLFSSSMGFGHSPLRGNIYCNGDFFSTKRLRPNKIYIPYVRPVLCSENQRIGRPQQWSTQRMRCAWWARIASGSLTSLGVSSFGVFSPPNRMIRSSRTYHTWPFCSRFGFLRKPSFSRELIKGRSRPIHPSKGKSFDCLPYDRRQ